MRTFINLMQDFRWSVIVATLIFVSIFTLGMTKIQFSGDYRVFFDPNNPYLLAFEHHQNVFDKSDSMMLALEIEDGSIFDKNNLRIIESITEELWKTPYASRVDSIANFQRIQSNDDDVSVEPTIENSASLTDKKIEEIREFVHSEPALRDRLIASNDKITAFFITLNYPPNPTKERFESIDFVRKMKAEYESNDANVKIHISGLNALNTAFVEATLMDIAKLTPLMILVILLVIGISLRSILAAATCFALVIFSALSAFGLGGWLGIPLAPPSLSAFNMILILTIASAIHVMVCFTQELSIGKDSRSAMQDGLLLNMKPLILTSLTTAIGFLSLNASEAPPYRHLGNLVTIGIVIAFVLTVTLLPAVMSFTKARAYPIQSNIDHSMTLLAKFVIRNPRKIFVLMSAIAVVFAFYAPKNRISDDYSKYFDHSLPFRNANDAVSKHLPALYTIEFELRSKGENGITDPEYLEHVEKFANWLRSQPYVANVLSFSDTMKRLNKSMNSDLDEYYRIPKNKTLASQYLLVYELSLPFGLDLNSQISSDRSSTRMIGSLYDLPTNATLELEANSNKWIRENLPEYMWINATSPAVMFCHIAKQNTKAGIIGGLYALALVSLALTIALKSIRLGFVSLIPNILPIIIVFGIWALYKGTVGLSLSLVVGIALGILVDDTVHFLTKFNYARKTLNKTTEDAMLYTFQKVGRAIILTSVSLIMGFGVLVMSAFAQNSDMAQFVVMAVFVALIYDLFLLPALILILSKDAKISQPVAHQAVGQTSSELA